MTQETRTVLKQGWVTNLTDGGNNTAAEIRKELDDIADSAYIKNTDTSDVITEGGTNLFYSQSKFDDSFETKDTDDLSEGASNFYFSEARFDASLTTKNSDDIIEGTTNLYATTSNLNDYLATKDSDDIVEGITNLYYTAGRFDTAFSGKTTDDLTEGLTNKYFNATQFNTFFSGKSTDDLAVGSTNLYFPSATQEHIAMFDTNNDGSGDIAADLTTFITDNVDSEGVAYVAFKQGTYICEFEPDMDALYTAGVRKLILDGRSTKAVTVKHSNNNPAFDFDNADRAGAPQAITSYALTSIENYNYISVLNVTDANTYFSKNDKVVIHSEDNPSYSATRIIGEGAKVKAVTSTQVILDKRLGFRDEYVTNPVIRKLDTGIEVIVQNMTLEPNGDSSDTGITTRSNGHSILFTAMGNSKVLNCEFRDPWITSVRMESCIDCVVKNCTFRDGLNQPAANQITYGLQAYGACYNCILVDSEGHGYRHGFTSDSDGSATPFVDANFWASGEPDQCGMLRCQWDATRGSAIDTHQEGLFIFFIDCTISNAHSADQTLIFIGGGAQIRNRRTLIKDCVITGGNYGIQWKAYEHGEDSWLMVENTTVNETHYVFDQGRGMYITSGGTVTTKPTLYLNNFTGFRCGTTLEDELGVNIEARNFSSIQPIRGHMVLEDGTNANFYNTFMDSDSEDLYGATTNRTMNGVEMTGTSACRLFNLTHKRGTVNTKNLDLMFKSTDAAAGKTIAVTNYTELDPTGNGYQDMFDNISYYTVEQFTNSSLNTTEVTAASYTVLPSDDVILLNRGTTIALTVPQIDYKVIRVVDTDGDAAANADTITPSTGTVNGAGSFSLSSNYQVVDLISDGTNMYAK